MRKLRAFWIRLLDLIGARRNEDDFAAELESHVEMHTDDGIRAGLTPEEARRQALIALGGAEQTRQAFRERRTLPWLETLWQDIRFGLRILCKNPGYTAVAVLTLALGIGANTAVFTVAQAALLRSWPAKEPSRLVRLIAATPQGEEINFSYADYRDLAEQTKSLEGIFVYNRRVKMLRVGAESRAVLDDVVSPNYFSVLGITAQAGRFFTTGPQPPSEPGVVISDSLWHRVFNADPSLVGKQIWLTNQAFTVLAVAPPGFRGLERMVPTDLWIPVATEYPSQELADRKNREFEVLGRLRPGATTEEARAELDSLGRSLAQSYPAADKARSVSLISERERLREGMIPTLILMTAVGLVLLICCANVAGLVLARSDARRKEVAMRLALGAGRLRLMRQLLTESLLLASVGSALGLLLAVGLLRLQPVLMIPAEVEVGLDLHLDASVLMFTAAVAILSVLIFGLAPAIQLSKTSLVSTLKGEGTGAAKGLRRWTLRNALVLGEIALSVVLLTASGLVVRSLLYSRSLPLGFDRQRQLIFFDLIPGIVGYHSERSAVFFEQVQEKAAALPGVRHAALARRVLLSDSGGGMSQRVSIPGVELPQGQLSIPIKFDAVDGNYFRAVGTRLMQGREFNSGDNPSTARVVVVSQTMEERFWPGQEVVGRQIVANGTACQIVGVVEDAKVNSVHETPEPYMYFPFAQQPSAEGTLIIEADGNSKALTARALSEIQRVDRNVPVTVRTVNYLMQQAFWADQMAAGFVAALGALGIFLGAIGLYGVVAFTVSRRNREIGIRMALGAERKDVLRLVLGHGLGLAAIGTAIGLLASFAAMRLLATMLYGVRPTDPLAFAGSAILVVFVALAASWIPARRAAAVDPMQSLRTE
jgi:predicted permease